MRFFPKFWMAPEGGAGGGGAAGAGAASGAAGAGAGAGGGAGAAGAAAGGGQGGAGAGQGTGEQAGGLAAAAAAEAAKLTDIEVKAPEGFAMSPEALASVKAMALAGSPKERLDAFWKLAGTAKSAGEAAEKAKLNEARKAAKAAVDALPAQERADAGFAIARFGDDPEFQNLLKEGGLDSVPFAKFAAKVGRQLRALTSEDSSAGAGANGRGAGPLAPAEKQALRNRKMFDHPTSTGGRRP